ncbi:MAG: hypothetical protein ABJN51_17080 [Sneathiella sp.]
MEVPLKAKPLKLNPLQSKTLARKGLVRENGPEEILITAEGLAFSTGLEDKFVSASDH